MYAGRAGAAGVGHGGGGGRRKSRGGDEEQDVHEDLVNHFQVGGFQLFFSGS